MGNHAHKAPTSLEEAHETYETSPGKREVKYPFAFKQLDWDEYHRYRPRYPDSMIDMWLSYHREHGNGLFHRAHDIGAGKSIIIPYHHPSSSTHTYPSPQHSKQL